MVTTQRWCVWGLLACLQTQYHVCVFVKVCVCGETALHGMCPLICKSDNLNLYILRVRHCWQPQRWLLSKWWCFSRPSGDSLVLCVCVGGVPGSPHVSSADPVQEPHADQCVRVRVCVWCCRKDLFVQTSPRLGSTRPGVKSSWKV